MSYGQQEISLWSEANGDPWRVVEGEARLTTVYQPYRATTLGLRLERQAH